MKLVAECIVVKFFAFTFVPQKVFPLAKGWKQEWVRVSEKKAGGLIGRTGQSPDPLLFAAGSDTWILRY